jgi:hypothetical protein
MKSADEQLELLEDGVETLVTPDELRKRLEQKRPLRNGYTPPNPKRLRRHAQTGRGLFALVFVEVDFANDKAHSPRYHTVACAHARARVANASRCCGQSYSVAGSKSAPLGQTTV